MPRGLSREPTLRETCNRLFLSHGPMVISGIVLPALLVATVGNIVSGELKLQLEPLQETQVKAADLWRRNGYDIGLFKSYEVLDSTTRLVTLLVTKPGDGQTYEATTECSRTCAIRKIAAVPTSPAR